MSKQLQDLNGLPEQQVAPKTKIEELEEKILEIEEQISELTGEPSNKKKKKPTPEIVTAGETESVSIEVQYDQEIVNFLSGRSKEGDSEEVKKLKLLRDQLVQEQARELRDEAEKNPANQKNREEEDSEKQRKGVITFATYEEAKKFADSMVKAYERLGIPCDLQYHPDRRAFVMKLPPQCRGKDVFSMSPEELAQLREEIAQGATVNKELGAGGVSVLPTTQADDLTPENGFAVTLDSLAKKLQDLASRKKGQRAEGDTEADLEAQIAFIEAAQDAVRSRMAEQLEKEQSEKNANNFVQIDMAQGEESAKRLASDLKEAGIDCSVVEKDGVFGVKIDLSNEIVREESDVIRNARPGSSNSPMTSPRGAGLDKEKSPALQLNGNSMTI